MHASQFSSEPSLGQPSQDIINNLDLFVARYAQQYYPANALYTENATTGLSAGPSYQNNQVTVSPSLLMMQENSLANPDPIQCSALDHTFGLMTPISEPNDFACLDQHGVSMSLMNEMKTECLVDNALDLLPVGAQLSHLPLPPTFLQSQAALQAQATNLYLSSACNGDFPMSPVSFSSPPVDSDEMRLLLPQLADPRLLTPCNTPQAFDHLYPSPILTPPITPPRLPQHEAKRPKRAASRAATARSGRSKHTRGRAYTDRSRGPSPPSCSRKCSALSQPDLDRDREHVCEEFKYGFELRVYDEKTDSYKKKWRCKKCQTTVGRKPDLHRHYKSCVNSEKHFCRDVTMSDGTLWPGCGVIFSRRDALHRHLRKRFSLGFCAKTKPKRGKTEALDEFKRRQAKYREINIGAPPRAILPADEKNRLVRLALPDVKVDMF